MVVAISNTVYVYVSEVSIRFIFHRHYAYIIIIHTILEYITLYVFIFPYLSLLAQPVTIFVYGPVVYGPPGTCNILDKKYNIANSSCHFGSYGSIWTGPSPKKYYMNLRSFGPYNSHMAVYGPVRHKKKYYMNLRSFGPYNIFLVTDRSIYCHMTLSTMNYLLYVKIYTRNATDKYFQVRSMTLY